MLAYDGTHVGPSLRFLQHISPIETADRADVTVTASHQRFDRTFITNIHGHKYGEEARRFLSKLVKCLIYFTFRPVWSFK